MQWKKAGAPRRAIWVLLAAAWAACAGGSVHAAGVLERVASGGKLVLGYRETAVPFSYLGPDKKPVGYALDLCLKLADAVRKKTGAKAMGIDLVPVTTANRIAMVAEGKVDLECGSTTNNADRREKVAFTIPHYITGARILVRSDEAVSQLEDLQGKRVVSTKGSTSFNAVDRANRERLLHITMEEAPDNANAMAMLEKGEADAFVMDDVQLYALASQSPKAGSLKVIGKFLTTEPLAIMLSKDDVEFKKVIDEEMRRLILSKEIQPIYDKWFLKPIPPNDKSLNLPVSYLLRDFWKYPSDFVPF